MTDTGPSTVAASAIVRFRSAGEVVGHGVLVDDDHVVTCAHVVNAVLGRPLATADPPIGAVVRLEFPVAARRVDAPPTRSARVDAWAAPGTTFEGVDAAGLTLLDEGRPSGVRPMPVAERTPSTGAVLLYGQVRDRPGGWVAARMRPGVGEHRQQLEQQARGSFVARPGFSGTPVVSEATGHMVGMLVAVAAGGEDTDAYAVPVSSLVDMWPQVFGTVAPSPYKGLEAFGQDDGELFFGRTAVVDELLARVATSSLVPLVGASGVGKSSVVHAGLVPRLVAPSGGRWAVVNVLPRPTLSLALAAGFARRSGSPTVVPATELDQWERRILDDGLDRAAQRLCASVGADRMLLIVDQFEEAVSDTSPEFELLLTQLAGTARERRDGLVTVLTLREDAFGTFFLRHAAFGERLRAAAVPLRGMSAAELHDVISRPAALRGVTVRPTLVEHLVAEVAGRPGALPLLEFSLDQMWQGMDAGRRELTFDAYEAIGRLDGALSAYADSVAAALPEQERSAVRRLFLNHLTAVDDIDSRRVTRRADIAPADWSVVRRLADARLVSVGRDGEGEETVEVVHEALLRSWGTLRTWLDAEAPFLRWRRLLRDALAQAHDQDGPPAVLTGPVLAVSQRWLAERGAELTLPERRLVERSTQLQDEEEHRYRQLYLRSRARALAAAAETAEDPEVALLLAVQALSGAPDPGTDRLVREGMRRLGIGESEPTSWPADEPARHRMTIRDWAAGGHTGPIGGRVEGEAGLVVDSRGRAALVAPASEPPPSQPLSEPLSQVPLPFDVPVVVAAYVPRAAVVCLVGERGEVAVLQTGGPVPELIGRRDLGVPVMCAALSGAADLLALACDDGTIRLVGTTGDLAPRAVRPCGGFVEDIDLSRDGRVLAVLTGDGRIQVWDLVSDRPRCVSLSGGHRPIAALSDGDHVLVGGRSRPERIPTGPHELADRARRAVGRDLTPQEWRRHVGAEVSDAEISALSPTSAASGPAPSPAARGTPSS